MAFVGLKGHLVNMFPLTFIEVGNTLSQHIMSDDDAVTTTTTATTLSSLTTPASIATLTQQHLLQQRQQHETTTDITLLLENLTHTSLLGGLGISSSGSGAGGVSALDAFEADSSFIYTPPLQRPETIFITILFLLIFIVGVLGNGTLVIIFFRHRSMRNIPNT